MFFSENKVFSGESNKQLLSMSFSGIRMVKLRNKKVTWLLLAMLVSSVFSVTHLALAGAQSSGKTVGLWHLD